MKSKLRMQLYRIKVKLKKSAIRYLIPQGFYFSHPGFCPCCDKTVFFRSESSWLRDYFICDNCGSIPRERALMIVIEKYYPNWKELAIHESSPGNRGVSEKLKKNVKKYTTSQFFPKNALGTVVRGWLNQNLEKLTFETASFDIFITQDVMEHVYDPKLAFAEIARTIKPGGAHIFTVPLVNKHKKSEIWAFKDAEGEPIFTNSPEWHGNVVDEKGSPVTMHWGFDIVNFIKEASGLETIIEHIDDLDYGIRSELIEVLISQKK